MNDNRLKELQEELNQIVFSENECDPEEIDRIVSLMDDVDPFPLEPIDAEASLKRFKEKYKDQLDKYFKKKRNARIKWICTLCASAAAVLIVFVQLDSSASYLSGFFKIFDEGKNGISFLVTGTSKEVYKSFDDLPESILDNLLIPDYIPLAFELDKITQDGETISAYYINSSDDASLNIKIYPGVVELNDSTEIVSGREVNISQYSDFIKAEFYHNEYVYYISGNIGLEEVKKVVSGLN